MNDVTAHHAQLGSGFGVVLITPQGRAHLAADEAIRLAGEIQSAWPPLATQLEEAAEGVDRMTRFDGPLGGGDAFEGEPGQLDRARQLLSRPQADR